MTNKKYHLLLTVLVSLGLSGCTNPMGYLFSSAPAPKQRVVKKKPKFHVAKYKKPSPEKSAKFQTQMKEVALSTQDDDKYNKMTLDTPAKKAWFKHLMYKLWDRQITRKQFIAEGLHQYPTKKYEFTFVADGFQKRS